MRLRCWVCHLVMIYFISEFNAGDKVATEIIATKHNTFSNADLLEDEFVDDLITSSSRGMNYLLFGVGLTSRCNFVTCEKYGAHNSKDLLSKRGLHIFSQLNQRETIRRWEQTKQSYDYIKERKSVNRGSSSMDIAIFRYDGTTQSKQNESIQTMNVIREYNSKCYMVILTDDEESFTELKTHILEEKIFNVYIVRRGMGDADTLTLYLNCAYCSSGVSVVKACNSWKHGQGFRKKMKYVSSFRSSFFGGTVNVGQTGIIMPAIFVIGMNEDGSPAYTGTEYLILQTLSKYLNFKLNIILQKHNGPRCLDKFDTGTTGLCKMLNEGDIELAGFPWAQDTNVYQHMDSTAVYHFTGNIIVSAKPGTETQWKSALDPIILVMVLISFLASVMAYWLVCKCIYKEQGASLVHTVFLFISTLIMGGIKVSSNLKIGKQIILGTWIICTFLVIFQIIATITSIAATPGLPEKPIDSVDDMIHANISWITLPGYVADEFLAQRDDVQHLRSKTKQMNFKEGLQYVLDHPKEYVYYFFKDAVVPNVNAGFWNGKGQNPFHYSPLVDGEPKTGLTGLFKKGAPYGNAISLKLLQIKAAGLLEHKFIPDVMGLFHKFNTRENTQDKAEDTEVADETFVPLGMGQMIFILSIHIFGIGATCIQLLAEIFYFNILVRLLKF